MFPSNHLQSSHIMAIYHTTPLLLHLLLNSIPNITALALNINLHRRSFISGAVISTAVIASPVLASDTSIYRSPDFSITLPSSFYSLPRKAKTGVQFAGGNVEKVEIVAVEKFPLGDLLKLEGVMDNNLSSGSIKGWEDVATASKLVELLKKYREKDSKSATGTKSTIDKESLSLSQDGKLLSYTITTNVPVQKPDLLFDSTGEFEIVRLSRGNAYLDPASLNIIVLYVSAKRETWKSDSETLNSVIEQFRLF